MTNVSALRHEKERIYLVICMIVGGLAWCILIWFAWILLIPAAIVSWLIGQYFKAFIYGNAVWVNQEQFGEIDQMVKEMARELNLSDIPRVFILSGQGALNALAIKFLTFNYLSYLFEQLPNLGGKALDELLPWSVSLPASCRINK